jgi:dipeptidyl-peptidase 4
MNPHSTSSPNLSSSLTSEDVAYGAPVNIVPTSLSISPLTNDLMLLFPNSLTGQRQLYQFSPSQNEFQLFVNVNTSGELSHEEKLRRERMRLFANGITSYTWGKREGDLSSRLLIPMNGQIIVFDPKYEEIVVVYDGTAGSAIDPTWSPNGKFVAFVLNRDVYYLQLPGDIPPPPLSLMTCISHRR